MAFGTPPGVGGCVPAPFESGVLLEADPSRCGDEEVFGVLVVGMGTVAHNPAEHRRLCHASKREAPVQECASLVAARGNDLLEGRGR